MRNECVERVAREQGKWGVSVLIAPVQDEKSSGNWLYSNVQRVNNTDLYD